MQYANPEKTQVICVNPETGELWTVPKGHRFWSEWGIDKAEESNEIQPADPTDTV